MYPRYIDTPQQLTASPASSSTNPRSRLFSTVGVVSPRSEDHPQQRTSDLGYRPCSTCNQRRCYCATSYEQTAGYETSDVQMSGSGPSIDLDCTRDGVQQLASQTAGDGFGAGSYDMTERQARHRQDMNGAAVQSGLLPQYSNTETGFNPSQTTPWSTWDGSRSGPPGFNALGDPSNVTTMEEDQNMVGYGYENEDDDDEDESMHGPEGQEPAKKLSDFEATYQPGQCTLKGCRKGHIFKTFRSYRSHIKNVHTKALWCKVSTCPHPRPFANRSDLNRHYEAKHGDKLNKPFKCLRADCTARAKAFKRKDKLQEHNANYHAEWCCFFCPRRRFETFEACAEHTNRHHVHVTGN